METPIDDAHLPGYTQPDTGRPEGVEPPLVKSEPPDVKAEPLDIKSEPSDTSRDPQVGGADMAVGMKREDVEGEGEENEDLKAMDEDRPPSPTLSPSLFPDEEVRKVIQCLQSLKQLLERAEHTTVSPVGVVTMFPRWIDLNSCPFGCVYHTSLREAHLSPPVPFHPSRTLPRSLSQVQPPIKAFPTSSRCFPESGEEFFPPLVRAMRSRRLVHCLFVLLSSPTTTVLPGVFEAVKDLLLFFLSTQDGKHDIINW